MAYFATSLANNAPPSTKHGWPVPANEAGVVWECTQLYPGACAACANVYDADLNETGDAGVVAQYCTLPEIVETLGSDLGGQNPGILLNTIRQAQKLLSYLFWLGAGDPAADSNYSGNYEFFTERWDLYVNSGGSSTTLTLARNVSPWRDPLELPHTYTTPQTPQYGPIQPGDVLQAMPPGNSTNPRGAAAKVCAVTSVSATSVTVRLTRPLYVDNGTVIAGYGNRAEPEYLPYPVPSSNDAPNLCANCRIDNSGSMGVIAAGLSLPGTGNAYGTAWYCSELLTASRVADFEAGKCNITTCSRYAAAPAWPPVPIVAWHALLAGQNLALVNPVTAGVPPYWLRPSLGAPSLASLLGDRAYQMVLSTQQSGATFYGGAWGSLDAQKNVRGGIFRNDSLGAIRATSNRACFTGGLQSAPTIQDATHRAVTQAQPTRRWPSTATDSPASGPGLWAPLRFSVLFDVLEKDDLTMNLRSALPFTAPGVVVVGSEKIRFSGRTDTHLTGLTRGYLGTDADVHYIGALVYDAASGQFQSHSEHASQTARKREYVFPAMNRNDNTITTASFGTYVFSAGDGVALTGSARNSKLSIVATRGRTFPKKALSTAASTIAAVTNIGNGVYRLEMTPEFVQLPYATVTDGAPNFAWAEFLWAGNAVAAPDWQRIRHPSAPRVMAATGDVYDLAQRGDTVILSGNTDYAFTVLRAEAMAGGTHSGAGVIEVDGEPIPGLPYARSLLSYGISEGATQLEIISDGEGWPHAGTIKVGNETVTYTGKSPSFSGTLLTGLSRSGVDSHEPDTVVVWDETGDRAKRDRIWIEFKGLAADETGAPQAGDSLEVYTSSVIAPTLAWQYDGVTEGAWADTGYTLAVRHREVDGATNEPLAEGVDYGVDRASGRIEVWDSAVGIDNTTLDGALDAIATTITVDDASGFPANGRVQIDSETIAYTGRSATTFNGCTRGVVGGAASHLDGALVRLADPAARELSGAITADAVTVTLDNNDGVPSFGTVKVDSEVIGYSGLSGATLLNCRRGAYGTTAATHASGAGVEVRQPWADEGQCIVLDGWMFFRGLYAGTSAGDVQAESLQELTGAMSRLEGCLVGPVADAETLVASVTVLQQNHVIAGDVDSWWAGVLSDVGDITFQIGNTLSSYKHGVQMQYTQAASYDGHPWQLGMNYWCELRGRALSGLGAWGRFPAGLITGAWADIRIVGGCTVQSVWTPASPPFGSYDGSLAPDPTVTLQGLIVNENNVLIGGTSIGAGGNVADGEWHRVNIKPLIDALSAYKHSEGYKVYLVVSGSGSVLADISGGFRDIASGWIRHLSWTWEGGRASSFSTHSERVEYDGDLQMGNWRIEIDWAAINSGAVEIPEVVHWPGSLPRVT